MIEQTPFVNWKLFPDFERILTYTKPSEAVPIFEALIEATKADFLKLENDFKPTWEDTMVPLYELQNNASRAISLLSHLNGVKNSDDLRETLQKVQPQSVKLGLLMSQSAPLFKALDGLVNSEAWASLDKVQQRIVLKKLRGMKHSGIGFAEGSPEKERFNAISERLSELSLLFGNHILDATKAFKHVVEDVSELKGCSETFLETLKQNAKSRDVQGYCITLDHTIYLPFMKSCENRSLREEIYRASVTKASQGDLNNEIVINEILSLKHEKANLLGYKTFADLSLSVKMAETLPAAEELVDRLFDASYDSAQKELAGITEFANTKLGIDGPLSPWDTAYVTEQYRKEKYKFDDEAISEYFAFPKVIKGLFDVADQVLGVQVRELTDSEIKDNKITKWHEDVKVFEVSEKGQVRAYFYGDFYSRPLEKRSGAWMDEVTTRYKHENGEVTLPVAYLICNQDPPRAEGEPSLMKFRDVETLFHEFGHCLQHMLTTVDYPQASGINGVEWDFVEVASQFMENFCQEPKWLARLSGHYKTNEPMPQEMIDTLVLNREFMSGMAMMRQLQFAKVDLILHSRFLPPKKPSDPTIFDMDAQVSKKVNLIPSIPQDRFLCSFSHIFAGGYSAGYYSYKWSETYSADAYAAFEEVQAQGKPVREIGQHYRDTILALGGGTSPREVWKKFRGRDDVDVNALLRHSGLAH
ncbi:hypothetical protein CLU79DRAFT_723439 [Phycomyces nitens]|nr:hypothetical protein CLU79DRAFT_723439 [Phycomyces nitens]